MAGVGGGLLKIELIIKFVCFGEIIVSYMLKLNYFGDILQFLVLGEQMKYLFMYFDILNFILLLMNIFGVVKVNYYLY